MPRLILLILCAVCLSNPMLAQNKVRFSSIKPGMRDAEIEREAVRLANKQARKYAWPEEFWQAKILSHAWEELRDQDGNLVAREIHIELYAVMNSGKCAMADCAFREKLHEDGKSTRVVFKYHRIGDMVNIPCE